MAVDAFGIEKEFLADLLDEAKAGGSQLPEFQRGWVWPKENIQSLLASVSLGYPVGTVMMLKTGGETRFKHRPIEGVATAKDPDRLILDGQQRLTSLFQALRLGRPIETQDVRKRKLKGWFYIDIEKALDEHADREEAFVFVPADKVMRDFRGQPVLDLSSPDKEYQAGMFPLRLISDYEDWLDGFDDYFGADETKRAQRKAFRKQVLERFRTFQVPVIELSAETPREAVCQVFEKVNTGGVTLTVFELLTATYAADEFDLRRDWQQRRASWSGDEYRVIHEVGNTDFLQTITLLATYQRRQDFLKAGGDEERAPRIGCRRIDILGLLLDDYRQWAPKAVRGYQEAAKLLHTQSVFEPKFLPYGSQLIPLAAVLALLGHEAATVGAQERLSQWLWCGVFGELYGGTTETRFGHDVPEVIEWVRGGVTEPRTVQEAQFRPDRLDTLRTRNSAAYKGLYALLMKRRAVDWMTGSPMTVASYFDDSIDIHHIFPKAWCEAHGVTRARYDSITNKTPLTGRTNRVIGGSAPSVYLPVLVGKAQASEAAVDHNIASHLVLATLLRADDFDGFMAARKAALCELVSAAIGKPVQDLPALADDIADPDDTDDE
jgi:hypothetical protein